MKLFLSLVLLLASLAPLQAKPSTTRFDGEILAFEKSDATNPPPKNAILFIGSSSIRMWKTLAKDFPNHTVINRGFGGSEITDSTHFAERVIFPYEPKLIVFYAGGNDINSGKSAELVFENFKKFAAGIHAKLPKTRIAFIAVAGNPSRWKQLDRIRKMNDSVERLAQDHPLIDFINVFPHMLGADGKPMPEIFLSDKLHMNAKGYAIRTRVIGEYLKSVPEL